ncbi:MAG: CopG family ribbon-helix-helix protein [Bacteroidota bacterium]
MAITLDGELLARIDGLVAQGQCPSRSRAIQEALREKLHRLEGTRLAAECAKLDPAFEQRLAEEDLSRDLTQWPEYLGAAHQ